MSFKDYFSTQSATYAKYRPHYPVDLFKYLSKISPSNNRALDLATGNGQASIGLIPYFTQVLAADASISQISNALQKDNINYFVSTAEQLPVKKKSIDLILCTQAIHWFDWDLFYREVNRVLKNNGIIAVVGYGLPQIEISVDEIIFNFYANIVGDFWSPERKHVDNKYAEIPFPYETIKHPGFENKLEWKFENLIGFLNSWSATQNYIKVKNENPVEFLKNNLSKAWGNVDKTKNIIWSFFVKIGKLKSN